MSVVSGLVRRQATLWGLYALVMFLVCAALTVGFLLTNPSSARSSRGSNMDPRLLAVVFGGLALFAGYHVVRNGRHLLDPSCHPAVRAINERPWGPACAAALLDPAQHVRVGRLLVTPVAIVDPGAARVIGFDDLLWAYHHQLTQKLYGAITTSRTQFVALATRDGQTHKARQRSEEDVRQTLLWVNRLAPWVVLGYSPSLEAGFKRSPAALALAVAQRRAAGTADAGAAGAAGGAPR